MVSAGVLAEIGRAQLPSAFNFLIGKEAPLVRRRLTLRPRRVSAVWGDRGVCGARREESSLAPAAAGVEAVTVALINAHANPSGARFQTWRTGCPASVIASTSIFPKTQYERHGGADQCLCRADDAQLSGQARRVSQRSGVTAPVHVTSNNGGRSVWESAAAAIDPSRRAGFRRGLRRMARGTGDHNVITVDIGGTARHVLIRDFTPAVTTGTRIENLPIIVPVIAWAMAGGGSIVSVDDHGMLKIGRGRLIPGPRATAAAARATITDCYVAAGYVDRSLSSAAA